MSAEERLDVATSTALRRLEMGHPLAAPSDVEVLSAMLNCVEEVGEVPSCVRRGDLGHRIRLSDYACRGVPMNGRERGRATAALVVSRVSSLMALR